MTLKIDRDARGAHSLICLNGRLRSEHLDELKEQFGGDAQRITLDLEGITLVDVEAVRFLNACEADGVELRHCPAYIREWMSREKI